MKPKKANTTKKLLRPERVSSPLDFLRSRAAPRENGYKVISPFINGDAASDDLEKDLSVLKKNKTDKLNSLTSPNLSKDCPVNSTSSVQIPHVNVFSQKKSGHSTVQTSFKNRVPERRSSKTDSLNEPVSKNTDRLLGRENLHSSAPLPSSDVSPLKGTESSCLISPYRSRIGYVPKSRYSKCKHCNKYFESVTSLVDHKCFPQWCQLCNLSFDNIELKNAHEDKVHRRKRKVCHNCNAVNFDSSTSCVRCSKAMSSSSTVGINETAEKTSKRGETMEKLTKRNETMENVKRNEAMDKVNKRNEGMENIKKNGPLEKMVKKVDTLGKTGKFSDIGKKSGKKYSSAEKINKKNDSVEKIEKKKNDTAENVEKRSGDAADKTMKKNNAVEKVVKKNSMPQKMDPNKPSRRTSNQSSKSSTRMPLMNLMEVLKVATSEGRCGIATVKSRNFKCVKCHYISRSCEEACTHYEKCLSAYKKNRLILEANVRWLCLTCKLSFQNHLNLSKHIRHSCRLVNPQNSVSSRSSRPILSPPKELLINNMLKKDYNRHIKHWCKTCGFYSISPYSYREHKCKERLAYMKNCHVVLLRLSPSVEAKYSVKALRQNRRSRKVNSLQKSQKESDIFKPFVPKQEVDYGDYEKSFSDYSFKIKTETGVIDNSDGSLSPYGCQRCGEEFSSSPEFEFHVQKKHYADKSFSALPVIQCYVCKRTFSSQLSLRLHACRPQSFEVIEDRGNIGLPLPIIATNSLNRNFTLLSSDTNSSRLTAGVLMESASNNSTIAYSSLPSSNQIICVNPHSYMSDTLVDDNSQMNVEEDISEPTQIHTSADKNRSCNTMNSFSLHRSNEMPSFKNATFSHYSQVPCSPLLNSAQHAAFSAEKSRCACDGCTSISTRTYPSEYSSSNAMYRSKNCSFPSYTENMSKCYKCYRFYPPSASFYSSPPSYYNKVSNSHVEEPSGSSAVPATQAASKEFNVQEDASSNVDASSSFVLSTVRTLANNETASSKCILPVEKLEFVKEAMFDFPDAWIIKSSSGDERYICPSCYMSFADKDDFATHCANEHNLQFANEGKVKVQVLKDSCDSS